VFSEIWLENCPYLIVVTEILHIMQYLRLLTHSVSKSGAVYFFR